MPLPKNTILILNHGSATGIRVYLYLQTICKARHQMCVVLIPFNYCFILGHKDLYVELEATIARLLSNCCHRQRQVSWRLRQTSVLPSPNSDCDHLIYQSVFCMFLPHTVNRVRFCFWRRHSVDFLYVYEISWELLNRFAPNSHGGRVWSLARNSLKVKVKGQRSRSQGTKTAFFGPFGGLRAVYVWQNIFSL